MPSTNFSFSLQPERIASGGDGPVCLAPPYTARLLDTQSAAVQISGQSGSRIVPLPLVQILGQCNRLRSLNGHAAQAVQALRAPQSQHGEIRRALDQLLEQGLLLDETALLERLTGPPAGPGPSPIEALFIRSCGRPTTLRRLLESLLARPLPDGLAYCTILDDSRQASERAEIRRLVEAFAPRLSIRLSLIDRAQRRRLLQAIAQAGEISLEQLSWLIEGDPDDPSPSYGASLNTALLLGAGLGIGMLDDDATLDAFVLPDCSPSPGFRRRQTARLHFPEPDWSLPGAHYPPLDEHPLAAHAAILGSSAAELANKADRNDARTLLDDLDPALLHFLSGPTRVRLTSSGTLGDPGTRSMHWLLAAEPAQLQPLLESPERGRALFDQRRLARSASRPELCRAFALMTTTLTGIDNRELLLPTQARGANEDLLFGALTGFLHPGTLHCSLPHMLFHQRPEPRRWQAQEFERARSFSRTGFLTRVVEDLAHSSQAAETGRRIELLGAAFRDQAASASLRERLENDLIDSRAELSTRLDTTRRTLRPPPWLDHDYQRAMNAQRSVGPQDQVALDQLAAELPGFLDRYAAALGVWPQAWQSCRTLGLSALLELSQ